MITAETNLADFTHVTLERALTAVEQLHSRRDFSGDGYGWTQCAECRQDYPCATIQAINTVLEA